MENETPKLKPCPFCGSEDVYIETFNGETEARVRCAGCGTMSGFFNDVASAANTWNYRPGDTMKAQMAEALDCCREWLHDGGAECDGECRQDEYGKACVQCLVIEALADYREEQTP